MSLIEQTCEICGVARGLDRHHILHRGMGGSKDPAVLGEDNLITLCRHCHRNIHEGGWELERSEAVLRVTDRRTGKEVMRRLAPQDFDAAAFFQLLNVIGGFLTQALTLVPYLDDEQLVEAFRASRALGKRSWLLQAAILYEAQRRSVYGDRSLEAISRKFEISLRQAQKYALVWGLFFTEEERAGDNTDTDHGRDEAKNVNVDAFSLEEPSWYVVAATESPEPRRWLAYAQDRKAENPRYSLSDFRQEINQAVGANALAVEENPAEITAPAGRIPWDCPWVKPYCTRAGRPTPAEDCHCDEGDDSPTGSEAALE